MEDYPPDLLGSVKLESEVNVPGLFGLPTSQELSRQRTANLFNQASNFANIPRGRGGVALGFGIGSAIGNAISGGGADFKRIKSLENIQGEVTSEILSKSPKNTENATPFDQEIEIVSETINRMSKVDPSFASMLMPNLAQLKQAREEFIRNKKESKSLIKQRTSQARRDDATAAIDEKTINLQVDKIKADIDKSKTAADLNKAKASFEILNLDLAERRTQVSEQLANANVPLQQAQKGLINTQIQAQDAASQMVGEFFLRAQQDPKTEMTEPERKALEFLGSSQDFIEELIRTSIQGSQSAAQPAAVPRVRVE